MAERMLPEGDEHQVIHLGGESAVIVPLDEYKHLRKQKEWRESEGRVRTSPEEFLMLSGLSEEDRRQLREKYAD
ncbi:hypothetical protein [Actinomadura rupiterrae]|uniref:hypothetical protein n=1 Tax=Actinomadura rupiterrae TaxID=559627 RepID=UPI0020A4FFE4|nr:hypothetical protein [Actinomadura rupiterrae]MCP2336880.1 PHD/YefM family antitoxin component YafN of YafNO toxin-antitoxin module [Actinomadura rupiterrae]